MKFKPPKPWKHGLRKVAEGVFARHDTIHIDAEELLRAYGYEVNAENLAMLRQGAAQVARESGVAYEEASDGDS